MVFHQTLLYTPRTLETCRMGPFCDNFVSFLKSLMMIAIHCQLSNYMDKHEQNFPCFFFGKRKDGHMALELLKSVNK